MMSNYVISEVSLSKLTCFVCEKPLSYFPIYNSKDGSSCGRCEAAQNGSFRNETFEEIAKNIEFPCYNKPNGCPEILLPKNVANHELQCKFQKFTCPFKFPKRCFWKGFAHDFLKHTKTNHPTNLLTNDCCFEVDFLNTPNRIKLMPYLEGLYLINYRWTWNQKLWCTVTQFGYEPIDDNLKYKIVFEDSRKQFSHTVYSDSNAEIRIAKTELDNLLRNPAAIIASFEFLQKQSVDVSVKKNVNADLLRHFECIVCMDYMIGPIYLCATGHSICQLCKGIVEECPICKSQIQTTRNYTLESVISDTEFSCKYEKCLFVGKGTDIKKHQEICIFIERDCPLKELYGCKKKFVYADFSDHIFMDHNKHWYKGDVISYPLTFDEEVDTYEDVYFFKYCSKLFRLNFSYRNELFTFVAKLMDNSEESSKYRFVVDILDTTKNKKRNGNRLYCSKDLKAEEQAIQISFASIEHLIFLVFNFRMFVLEN